MHGPERSNEDRAVCKLASFRPSGAVLQHAGRTFEAALVQLGPGDSATAGLRAFVLRSTREALGRNPNLCYATLSVSGTPDRQDAAG